MIVPNPLPSENVPLAGTSSPPTGSPLCETARSIDMTSKHDGPKKPTDKDLKENPGIGQSAGLRSPEEADLLEGENTFEGDTDNRTNRLGGVDPRDRQRDNR
jgi:hypothetical protein